MSHEQVTIRTNDGDCPTHVFTPASGHGPWPAVIVYMDGFGIRPAMFEMSQRLADAGYLVLLPDLYYRAGPYAPLVPAEIFKSGDVRGSLGSFMGSTGNRKAGAEDTAAFLTYLDSRSDVAGEKIGTVGFCMGGGMAFTAAGTYPDRVAAAISFHGGRLATDEPDSPHLLAPKIKGELYVGVADNDASYPPEMAEKFEAALDAAGVTYRSELYEGAAHGWMKPDFPIYDEAAAERGWKEMLGLFGRKLHAPVTA